MTSPLPSLRSFLALDLMTVWPIETWPSPPITPLPPLRTVKIVVPCQTVGSLGDACMKYPRVRPDLGILRHGYNRPDSATIGAFSSEVDTGSRQENASNQESRAQSRFNRNGKGSRSKLSL